jgi:amidase
MIKRESILSAAVALAVLFAGMPSTVGASDAPASSGYDVTEKSVATLEADLASGRVTAEALTAAYLARIAAMDSAGPKLQSIIALNPHALDEAKRSDRRRASGSRPGALEGIPVLVKDNIETADGIATTAGSSALRDNVSEHDAPLIARLRAAGAIVLGKTNLSEWANFRSTASISGWSAMGGLVKNPYALDRTACGSSSGTGAAIAASFAAVGIGTETDGSVTCPSSMNGLVGLKPTVGLVSRARVVPISHDQDTAGPMGRSVGDVAALLSVIAGSDPNDPATAAADRHKRDYLAAIGRASLTGKRLGVPAYAMRGQSPAVAALFKRALATLRARGATIVEIPVSAFKPNPALGDAEFTVLLYDFKTDLNAYLKATPPAVRPRTLAKLIAYDRHDPRELQLFGQEIFTLAEATKGPTDPKYRKALAICKRFAGPEGIDRAIAANHLDALVVPSYAPASLVDFVGGDEGGGGGGDNLPPIGSLAAVSGYPHLTVPMGNVRGMPVGISFVGGAWSEASLLALGAAYERAAHARRPPAYPASIETDAHFAPIVAAP